MIAPQEGIPEPHDNDDDDVAWALQTATVQWKRAAYSDAIAWLRRAVEFAAEAGHGPRASELDAIATRLAESVLAVRPQTDPGEDDDEIIRDDDLVVEIDDAALIEEVDVEEVEDASVPDLPREPPPPSDVVDSHAPRRRSDVDIPNGAVVGAVPASAPPPPPQGHPPSPSAPPPRRPPRPPSAAPSPRSPVSAPPPRRPSAPHRPSGAHEKPASRPLPQRPSPPQPPPGSEPSGPPPALRYAVPEEDLAADEAVPDSLDLPAPEADDDVVVGGSGDELLPDLDDEDDEMTSVDALPRDAPVHVHEDSEAEDSLEAPDLDSAALGAPALPTFDEGARHTEAEHEPDPTETESELPDQDLPDLGSSDEPPDEAPEVAGEPSVLGVKFADVRGFEDLPEEAQALLASRAKLEVLQPDEEVSFFAVALVVKGDAAVVPAISDTPCGYASRGDVIFTQGNLPEGVALGVSAGPDGAAVATWDQEALDGATAECPWVADELREVADRFQAMAGATMGVLGERLDESLLASVFAKCQVRLYFEGDVVFESGAPVQGLFIVGAGRLVAGDEELGPGDLVFPACTPANAAAPATVAAGAGGALLLHVGSHETHELMMMVPPLLEILSMG